MGNALKKNSLAASVLPFKTPLISKIECRDNLSFMRSLPDNSMQLIVTSPPYNLGKEYESRKSLHAYQEEQAAAIAEAVRLLDTKGSDSPGSPLVRTSRTWLPRRLSWKGAVRVMAGPSGAAWFD